ncbi:hypothetical protein [Phaeobacter inhibens]|uniref:hypothetical protein n=1 Tax=Phaeobacter inhibens TaxID=221822 RepID=UPI00295F4B05|nr:hypothetical protein [Phaeobacter inhibens]
MDQKSELEWENASVEERREPTRELFRIVQELARTTGEPLDRLLGDAQGAELTLNDNPYRNHRKGEIAWWKARNIHEWLASNQFEFAQGKAPELFQYQRQSDWDRFLEACTVEGGVEVVIPGQFGIARREPPEDGVVSLRIGQAFFFELGLNEAGHVVAFEQYKDMWHPLSLGEDERRLRVSVKEGKNALPRDGQGAPIPLHEYDDTGPHRFVFVVCFEQKLPEDRTSIVSFRKDVQLSVYQVRTRVIT